MYYCEECRKKYQLGSDTVSKESAMCEICETSTLCYLSWQSCKRIFRQMKVVLIKEKVKLSGRQN